MMTDIIGDMLTRIRNAQMAKHREVIIPFSRVKFRIAEILRDEGFVEHIEKIEDRFGSIRMKLKYSSARPVIQSIIRVSKPGHRMYIKKEEMPVVKNGFGIAIISTSAGIMTNKEAKKQGLGGEYICSVA